MGLFSTYFKQLFSRRERRTSASSSSKNKKSTNNSLRKNSITTASNNQITTTTISTSHQSSKEGHSFKYNEDGRRYHGNDEVAYVLPNDDDEADRVHQQHWILRYILQRNYQAPVTKMLEEGITVLDSGCGPATWTFEMGESFPHSKFYGLDVSCVFPENIKPANVEFVIANIAKHIPFPDNTFDYIHQRLLLLGLTNENWGTALQELYRVLKPGGYIELAEMDVQDLLNMGPLFTKLQDTTTKMLSSRGMPKQIAAELENRLVKAGLVNQVLKITPLPMNHSGKAGDLFWADYRHGYSNAKPVLAKITQEWEDNDVFQRYLDACAVEAKENKVSLNWYAYYAQKPLEE